MSDQIVIEATDRQTGKGAAGRLRRDKQIPAVVYGPKQESTPITIQQNAAVKYTGYGYENTIFTIKGGSLGSVNVLVKSVSRHPVTHIPKHIDFYAPDMTKTVRVNVEVKFEGKPAGAQDGGNLNIAAREIEIECLPNDIPESFTLDVSPLELNGAMHVKDIKLSDKYKLISSEDLTLCTCAVVVEKEEAPAAEGEAAEGEAAAGDAAAAPAAGGEEKKS